MVIFIEGATTKQSYDSSSLKLGFVNLIGKLSPPRKRPEIIMGADRGKTLKKYKDAYLKKSNTICLIDLDGNENTKDQFFIDEGLSIEIRSKIFFMVVEMESWFLSQPEILNKKYGLALDSKHFTSNFRTQDDPKAFILKKVRALGGRGGYDVLVDGGQLLQRLDDKQLRNDFPDVKRLCCLLNGVKECTANSKYHCKK